MQFHGFKRLRALTALAVAGVLALASAPAPLIAHCGADHGDMKKTTTMAKMDIVDTAVAAGDFNTLVAAVKAAGLVEALKGDGPFTVFAPTDEAFAKLPKGTIEDLLKAENRATLSSILMYHVVSGQVPSEKALNLKFASTLNGQRINLKTNDGKLFVDGAQVVATDVKTTNGVIHVLDSVIMPAQTDIIDTATQAGSFKTLAAALKAADLVEVLKGEGPFTVFAPTEEAFAALPKGTVAELLKPENRDKLTSILKYHVVSGRVYSDQALKAGSATTLQEGKVTVGLKDGGAMVNDSKLVTADIETTNGVIHVIDKVLMPLDGMSSRQDVREIIEMAINRGAPLYNNARPEACAAIYEVTATSLVRLADIDASDSRVLSMALRKAQRTHSASEQAWILRDALDEVYESNGFMRSATR